MTRDDWFKASLDGRRGVYSVAQHNGATHWCEHLGERVALVSSRRGKFLVAINRAGETFDVVLKAKEPKA